MCVCVGGGGGGGAVEDHGFRFSAASSTVSVVTFNCNNMGSMNAVKQIIRTRFVQVEPRLFSMCDVNLRCDLILEMLANTCFLSNGSKKPIYG